MRRLVAIATLGAVGLALGGTAKTGVSGNAQTRPAETKVPWAANGATRQILDLVNRERSQTHARELFWDDKLAKAAYIHALDMAKRSYFSHESPEGRGPEDRVHDAGYAWSRVGENIAEGQSTPSSVVKSWMNSPPHRANILDNRFYQTGIAYAKDKAGRMIWVQVFAKPME